MATYTDYLGLEKPAQTDLYNIDVFNDNADAVDAGVKKLGQSLAPIETTNKASRSYAVGAYLVYNGLLYKVTTAIASGGTITPNSNVTAVNVGGQLSAINDTVDTLGLTYSVNQNTEISVPTGTNTKIAQLDLPKGVRYIVEFCVIYKETTASNAGVRMGSINVADAFNSGDMYRYSCAPSVGNGANSNESKTIFLGNNSSDNTYYLYARQTSGQTLQATGYIKALRIM